MPYVRKRKHSAVASGPPIGAPLSTELMQQEQAAGDGPQIKTWTPALHLNPKKSSLSDGVPRKFTVEVPYAILILNQPITDVELFVTICRKGKYWSRHLGMPRRS